MQFLIQMVTYISAIFIVRHLRYLRLPSIVVLLLISLILIFIDYSASAFGISSLSLVKEDLHELDERLVIRVDAVDELFHDLYFSCRRVLLFILVWLADLIVEFEEQVELRLDLL